MNIADTIIVIIYLVAVFGVATYFSKGQGTAGFLVNSRATKLAFLVASIVSTNVGAGFFLSVAAEGYETGISFGTTMVVVSIATSLTLAILAGRIKRLGDQFKASTVPELLTEIYGSPSVGLVAAIVVIFGYLFVTGLQFVGIGAVGTVISGISFNVILLIAGIVTIVYTAIGGLRSNFYADALSFVIMVVILILIVPIIFTSGRVDFATLPSTHFDLFAFAGVPFFAMALLLSIVSAFMFMELWQRIFAAENIQTARRAFYISAVLQPPLIGAGILLGLVAAVMYEGIEKSTGIFRVMADFLPTGLLGLGLVAILAILMSTVNSLVVVGGSTLFTIDAVKRRLKNKSDREQLFWVRTMTVVFGCLALLMAFALPDLVRLLLMGAFVMMPLCPAIIWSLFSKKLHAGASVVSMIAGIAITLVLLPVMPDTAFGPGFLISLLVLVVGHFVLKPKAVKE